MPSKKYLSVINYANFLLEINASFYADSKTAWSPKLGGVEVKKFNLKVCGQNAGVRREFYLIKPGGEFCP